MSIILHPIEQNEPLTLNNCRSVFIQDVSKLSFVNDIEIETAKATEIIKSDIINKSVLLSELKNTFTSFFVNCHVRFTNNTFVCINVGDSAFINVSIVYDIINGYPVYKNVIYDIDCDDYIKYKELLNTKINYLEDNRNIIDDICKYFLNGIHTINLYNAHLDFIYDTYIKYYVGVFTSIVKGYDVNRDYTFITVEEYSKITSIVQRELNLSDLFSII